MQTNKPSPPADGKVLRMALKCVEVRLCVLCRGDTRDLCVVCWCDAINSFSIRRVALHIQSVILFVVQSCQCLAHKDIPEPFPRTVGVPSGVAVQ